MVNNPENINTTSSPFTTIQNGCAHKLFKKQKFKVLKEMADAYSFVKGGKLKLKGHKDKK